MSRKDFQLIARVLKYAYTLARNKPEIYGDPEEIVRHIINDFAFELRTTNERFDKDKFKRACGVDEAKV